MTRTAWTVFGLLAVVAVSIGRRMLAPVRGPVSSRFGERRPSGAHNGTDVAVPVGTPVLAPANGRVVLANYSDKGGYQLRIEMTNGYTVGFAHLSGRTVGLNETVERGQQVATTGATGIVTGPHLHVTLTDPDGVHVDPERFFSFA